MITNATTVKEIIARLNLAIVRDPAIDAHLIPGDEINVTLTSEYDVFYLSSSKPVPKLSGGRFRVWLAQKLGVKAICD